MKKLGTFLAIIYEIMFFIVAFVLIIMINVKSYLSEDFYTNLIASDEFMNLKVTDYINEEKDKEELKDLCGDNCTIKNIITKSLSKETNINEDKLNEALNDKDVQKALGNLMSTYVNNQAAETKKKIEFEKYESVLDKEISKEIMKESNLTKENIKELIDKYNSSLERAN